jgi:hypothetical protein
MSSHCFMKVEIWNSTHSNNSRDFVTGYARSSERNWERELLASPNNERTDPRHVSVTTENKIQDLRSANPRHMTCHKVRSWLFTKTAHALWHFNAHTGHLHYYYYHHHHCYYYFFLVNNNMKYQKVGYTHSLCISLQCYFCICYKLTCDFRFVKFPTATQTTCRH